MITISTNIGGLSNRIKSWVSVIRINSNNYKVKWDVLDSYKKNIHILNCKFIDLFENKCEFTEKINKNYQQFNSHCLFIKNDDKLPNNFNTFKSNCKKKFKCPDEKKRNIDFMYNKIPDKLKKDYIKLFQIPKPIKLLNDKIINFSKQFTDKTISVHIRTWNRNGENGRRKYLFNIEKFEKKMLEFDNTYNFFICSDSEEVINKFKNNKKFKNRIYNYPRKSNLNTSRDFKEGIQEDLIELYLLSKNNIIIGSRFSTFTEVAWWIGGCTENIFIL